MPVWIAMAFPIDRRAIADRADLGLTEGQIRGAIKTLEAASFLDRAIVEKGPRYQRTSTGELHRKPVLFTFGSDYAPSFIAAIKRSRKHRGGRPRLPHPPSQTGTGSIVAADGFIP